MYLSQVLHSEELELIYTYVISFHQILGGELADVFMLQMVPHSASLCSPPGKLAVATVDLSPRQWHCL